jgi:glutaminase
MTCSLIRPDGDAAGRFDHVTSAWSRLSGGRRIGFDNAVYLSERETAYRNFSLAYEMQRSEAFRPGVDLQQTLEFYFQNCSIDVDAEILATAAASLANAGTCPLTDDQVFSPDTVRNCLSLMASCGMYDFSGEFAFTIGLPAKSGVSGGVMLVIPGVMGISIWSPRLDEHGNSVRGIEFCKRLVAKYNLHVFDPAKSNLSNPGSGGRRDPRRHRQNS